jgi:uncharacterized protein involved in oxidation of intracellular sulfur
MKILTILNDAPYGSERSYNGLRLALSLAKRADVEQRIFLMADAVGCGRAGQTTPNGYYNIERMIRSLLVAGVAIGACGSCMDARGLLESDLTAGCHRSSMNELTDWTIWADKVVTW